LLAVKEKAAAECTPYIKLPYSKHQGAPKWLKHLPSPLPTDALILDKQSFVELLEFLIDNSYFQFAGKSFKQTKGIVMGSNMAVHLANLYLFTYEFDFIRQQVFKPPVDTNDHAINKHNKLVWNHARKIIQAFMYTGRYIDDLITIGNRWFEPALLSLNHPVKYNIKFGDQPPVIINGIYPCAFGPIDGFSIEVQRSSPDRAMYNWFMDLAIYRLVHEDIPCSQYFKTGIYNKRKFALHMLPPPAYTHIHSHCSHWSKLSTFYSQVIRATRICNDYPLFIQESTEFFRRMMRAHHKVYDMWPIIYKGLKFAARRFGRPLKEVIDDFMFRTNDTRLDYVVSCQFDNIPP
jgi:hypothetical protein